VVENVCRLPTYLSHSNKYIAVIEPLPHPWYLAASMNQQVAIKTSIMFL
jgi:hypothetical protein